MKLNKEQQFLILMTVFVVVALLASQALIPAVHAADRSVGCAEFNRNGSTNNSQQFYKDEVLYVRITINGGTVNEAGIYDHANTTYLKSSSGTFTAGDVITASYRIPADGSYNVSYGWEPANSPSVVFSCSTPEDTLSLEAAGFIFTEDGLLVEIPVDDRFNWHNGDLFAMIYPGSDSEGDPALDLYCIVDDGGVLGFHVTDEEIAAHSEDLPQSVPVMEAAACNAAFYVLDDGEYPYQINIWDDEGKLYETLCTDLTCATRISRFTDPHQ